MAGGKLKMQTGNKALYRKLFLRLILLRNFLVGLCYDAVKVSINFELKNFGECKR